MLILEHLKRNLKVVRIGKVGEKMNCVICGKQIEKSKYMNKNLCSSECFHIDFWNEQVENKNDSRIVRINGEQFHIGNENSNTPFRGFSGAKHKIKFFDGREITTTNLWFNGKIPKEYKELLPDNAKFIRDININQCY